MRRTSLGRQHILWGMIFLLLIFPGLNFAKTSVNGIQSGVWTKRGSPYIVTDDLIIPTGLTLTIEPGVIIKFSGPYRFIVAGALIASGTPTDRIIFTTKYDEIFEEEGNGSHALKPGALWYGIDFTDSSDDFINTINHCMIRYSQFGVRCRNAYPLLTHIIFANTTNPYLTINDKTLEIRDGNDYNYLTSLQKPNIEPVAPPPEDTEQEKQKRLEMERLVQLQKMKEDSIKLANKIKPTEKKCGIIVLDAKNIHRIGFDTFPEILSFSPGFISMASYWESSVLTSRGVIPGQFNNRMLFLIDGSPFYDGITNSTFFDYIPLNTVNRIEIHRGPQGANFGKNAVSAVINLITDPSSQPVHLQTVTAWGSFYTKKIISRIDLNNKTFNVCIGTSYHDGNGYSRILNADELGNKFPFVFENDNYNLMLSTTFKNLNFAASYFKNSFHQFGIVPVQQYSGLAEREGIMINANYSFRINPEFSTILSTRFNQTKQENDVGELGVSLLNTTPPNYTISDGYLIQAEAKMMYHSPLYPTTFGVSVERYVAQQLLGLTDEENGEILTDFAADENPCFDEFATFAQSSYNFSPFVGCVYGARWHYFGKGIESIVSPFFRLIYDPFASYFILMSYQHGYRSPSLWERQVQIPDILYGSKILQPEQIHSIELEVEHQFSEWGKINLCGYWEFISDLIQQRKITESEQSVYNSVSGYLLVNSDVNYEVTGCEISLQSRLSNTISVAFNTTYQQMEKKNYRIYGPQILGNLYFNYQCNSNVMSSVYFQYLGEQSGGDYSITTNPYYLINVKLSLALFPNVFLEMNANNLLNEKCHFAEYNRRIIPLIPGGYPRAFFLLLKTEF